MTRIDPEEENFWICLIISIILSLLGIVLIATGCVPVIAVGFLLIFVSQIFMFGAGLNAMGVINNERQREVEEKK